MVNPFSPLDIVYAYATHTPQIHVFTPSRHLSGSYLVHHAGAQLGAGQTRFLPPRCWERQP